MKSLAVKKVTGVRETPPTTTIDTNAMVLYKSVFDTQGPKEIIYDKKLQNWNKYIHFEAQKKHQNAFYNDFYVSVQMRTS